MREIVARRLTMAADLSSDLMVVIKDDNPSKRDALVARIERFLYKIRNNEEMRTFVHRRDEMGKTTMMIGMDEHASKDAIVKAIWTRAEKEAGTDIQIWTKDMKDMKDINRTASLDCKLLNGLVKMGAIPAPNMKLAGPIRWQAVFFIGPAGSGKCFGEGTKILMFDGKEKNVEDIVVGDKVMGDDSSSRTVLEVHSGNSELYKITPVKGDSFVVNGDHILVFKRLTYDRETIDGKRVKKNFRHEDVEMTVKDFLKRGKSYQKDAKLFRVPVEYPEKKVEINPYIMGIWLGDGDAHRLAITTMDKPVENEFRACVGGYEELSVREEIQQRGLAKQFHATSGKSHKGHHGGYNSVMNIFKNMGLMPEKRIHESYLINSSKIRLEILAGLLDSDGSLGSNCFEITQKRKLLAEDIVKLSKSLGFFASISDKFVKGNKYYRVCISGDTDKIPCRLNRKIASKRGQKKSVLHTGFSINSIGDGRYFGFEVDGNHRHLLSDFTVVHNSFVKTKKYLRHLDFKEVDPDEIKKTHPNYDPENPFEIHAWSRDIAQAQLQKLMTDGSGSPVIVDGTGRDFSKIEKQMKMAEANGYNTHLVYVYVPFEVSIWRNRNRERFVPEGVIMEQSKKIDKNYRKLKTIADKSKVVLNYEKPEQQLALQDIEVYPVPQPKRPPRPGDPDYGVEQRAASELIKIARELLS